MGTQLVLSFAKRYFFNLSNALNSKHNSQTIRILSPYRNISLFSFVFIISYLRFLHSAALRVFTISDTIVIGPTPPGTGVIYEALGATVSKSTSPRSL